MNDKTIHMKEKDGRWVVDRDEPAKTPLQEKVDAYRKECTRICMKTKNLVIPPLATLPFLIGYERLVHSFWSTGILHGTAVAAVGAVVNYAGLKTMGRYNAAKFSAFEKGIFSPAFIEMKKKNLAGMAWGMAWVFATGVMGAWYNFSHVVGHGPERYPEQKKETTMPQKQEKQAVSAVVFSHRPVACPIGPA